MLISLFKLLEIRNHSKMSYKLPISVFRPVYPLNTFLGYLIHKSNHNTFLIKIFQ